MRLDRFVLFRTQTSIMIPPLGIPSNVAGGREKIQKDPSIETKIVQDRFGKDVEKFIEIDEDIILKRSAHSKLKNVSLVYLPENSNFLNDYRHFNIQQSWVKYVVVPTTNRPVTRLTPQYRSALVSHKLRPIKTNLGIYDDVSDSNFFLDLSQYINASKSMYKISNKWNSARGILTINNILNSLTTISQDTHYRVLLYSVCLSNPLSTKYTQRMAYPIYNLVRNAVKDNLDLPFDKILLYTYNSTESNYTMIYDKEQGGTKISRFRNFIFNLKDKNIDATQELEIQTTVATAMDKVDIAQDNIEHNIVSQAIENYIKSDPEAHNQTMKEIENNEELIATAILYHVVGDALRAKKIAKELMTKEPAYRKKLLDTYKLVLLERTKVTTTSSDTLTKLAKPADRIDNQVPTHILEKRKRDFKENLHKDVKMIFKPLETQSLPFKVTSVKVEKIVTDPGELLTTIKDKYTILLDDHKGKQQKVELEVPHLTEGGVFLLNGQKRVLVNQLILYPIRFLKTNLGMFESMYSSASIESKQVKRGAYLITFFKYKMPLCMLLGYKMGFRAMMNLFDIKYVISEGKPPNAKMVIKMPDGRFVGFNYEDNNIGGEQLVESINYSLKDMPAKSKKFTFEDSEFWEETIVKKVGNRNCIYNIDQTWQHIVTPIEKEILASKGDPTEIGRILKYISNKVAMGYVDDRNSLDIQRIRTSEVMTQLMQKQVISAYNEYSSKINRGDTSAKLYIDPKKVYTQIQMSQNVQLLENINPMEELSMMTRTTPIGIGGIKSTQSFPQDARNNHYTYYGNIDPLETPDSELVGIVQHLTVGAAISNLRGQFAIKDRSMIKGLEILSCGPAMVPFVESNDGARVMMGTGQTKQAVPLEFKENPAIQTGFESLLTNLLSDSFIEKAPVDGQIVEVTKGQLIIIKDEKGKKHAVSMHPRLLNSGQGKKGLSTFTPLVKVGQKVKKGQILAEGGCIHNGMISNGRNLLTAYMTWKGFNYEDGIVVSETAAKKLTSVHIEEIEVIIDKEDDIVDMLGLGDEVNKGGIVIKYSPTIYDVETFKSKRSDGGGIVSKLEIFSNIPEKSIPEKLKPHYLTWKSNYESLRGDYPIGKFRIKTEKIEGILIKYTIESRLVVNAGDKLNNRHGAKGVVSIVEKDENMPLTPWGDRIEVICAPVGVFGRMNSGQILELHTGLISKKLGNLCIQARRTEFISMYSKILKLLDGSEGKTYSETLLKGVKSLSDTAYKNMVEEIKKTGFIPLMFPPFKSPPRENIIEALKVLGLKPRYPVYIPEYDVKSTPVAVGYTYVQKLEHLADKKHSSRSTGPYQGMFREATAGKKRGGGQKFSEYEIFALLSKECPAVIEEFFGPLSSDHTAKNTMISNIINNGSTELLRSKANPAKEIMSNYFTAIHLTSE